MDKKQIQHLGTLSRIKLSDEEVERLPGEITSILDYVSTIDEVVKDGALKKEVGAVYNVFREDVVTNEPNAYTEDLLNEAPEREGRFLKVKKILNQDE